MTLKPGAKSSPKLNIDWLKSQTKNVQKEVLETLTALSESEAQALLWNWPFWARQDQLPPPGTWTSWMMLGGRGAGKTRAGAEWVRGRVEANLTDGGCRNIALVGETTERYRVRLSVEGRIFFETETQTPEWIYARTLQTAHAEKISDDLPATVRLGVAQMSAEFGAGPEAVLNLKLSAEGKYDTKRNT